jgi:hypothetical protein
MDKSHGNPFHHDIVKTPVRVPAAVISGRLVPGGYIGTPVIRFSAFLHFYSLVFRTRAYASLATVSLLSIEARF